MNEDTLRSELPKLLVRLAQVTHNLVEEIEAPTHPNYSARVAETKSALKAVELWILKGDTDGALKRALQNAGGAL